MFRKSNRFGFRDMESRAFEPPKDPDDQKKEMLRITEAEHYAKIDPKDLVRVQYYLKTVSWFQAKNRNIESMNFAVDESGNTKKFIECTLCLLSLLGRQKRATSKVGGSNVQLIMCSRRTTLDHDNNVKRNNVASINFGVATLSYCQVSIAIIKVNTQYVQFAQGSRQQLTMKPNHNQN